MFFRDVQLKIDSTSDYNVLLEKFNSKCQSIPTHIF